MNRKHKILRTLAASMSIEELAELAEVPPEKIVAFEEFAEPMCPEQLARCFSVLRHRIKTRMQILAEVLSEPDVVSSQTTCAISRENLLHFGIEAWQ